MKVVAWSVGGALVAALVVHHDQQQRAQMDSMQKALAHVEAEVSEPRPPAIVIQPQPVAQGVPVAPAPQAVAPATVPAGSRAGTAAPTPAEKAPEEPSAAFEQATTTLDDALSRGVLRRDDLTALRASLPGMSDDEGFEIRRRIAVAIDTDRLVPEDPHRVFP